MLFRSDGGFVEDAPKSKKSKGAKADGGMQNGADGEVYWEVRIDAPDCFPEDV